MSESWINRKTRPMVVRHGVLVEDGDSTRDEPTAEESIRIIVEDTMDAYGWDGVPTRIAPALAVLCRSIDKGEGT